LLTGPDITPTVLSIAFASHEDIPHRFFKQRAGAVSGEHILSEGSTAHLADSLATRLAFLVAGFGVACWAPLVPFAKQRLQVDEGVLGLSLLCVGLGSVAAMLLAGVANARYGSRPAILVSGFSLAIFLPLLAVMASPLSLGITLFVFGAALGGLDVSMNVHAIEVEHAAAKPLMSGFHALFSVGGFIGATLITFLLSSNITPLASTLFASALMAIAMGFAAPRLLRASSSSQVGPFFVAPTASFFCCQVLPW
jgi:predicted MFS family arabinose efflux permease